MALAKYAEELISKIGDNLANVIEPLAHPSILASRARPVSKTTHPKTLKAKKSGKPKPQKLTPQERHVLEITKKDAEILQLKRENRRLQSALASRDQQENHFKQRCDELERLLRQGTRRTLSVELGQ